MAELSGLEGGVYLGFHEQRKLDVAYRVIHRQLNASEGARLLGKSLRQMKRIVAKIRAQGPPGAKHGNTGRQPWNRTDETTRKVVLQLLRERYFDFNLTHAREKLRDEHGLKIRRETLRKWAHAACLVKRAKRKRRSSARPHKLRPRLPQAGMMLQMDGSKHRWLGKDSLEFCLIGAIDDATSICPYAEFSPAEDTLSVLSVLKNIVERVGVPEVLYVDQAGHFGNRLNRIYNFEWEKHLTHVERAMEELGCRVLFATSPQAKGRIERMWGTFQDRLVPELRLAEIKRIPSANAYLHEKFLPQFNRQFSVPPARKKTAFRPIPEPLRGQLEWVFSLRERRKVSSGESISWNAQTYVVNNAYGLTLKGHTIEIKTRIDGETRAFFAGRPLTLTPVTNAQDLRAKAA
jgi:hypothetical protein